MAAFLTYPITQLNPFSLIGTQFTAGLDAVVEADADIESIVQAVYDYVQPIYYAFPASEAAVENELKGVIYKALNGFGNQLVRRAGWMGGSTAKANVFNNRQQVFIELMLNSLQAVPVKAIDSYLSDLEDHITSSRLSIKEQAPLLMATLMGRKSFAYWMDKVLTPGDWSTYFNANTAINYANFRFWVSSSIQGALLAATRNRNNDKSQNVSIEPAFALAAGLAVTAGRVMLGYITRRTKIHFELAKLQMEKFIVFIQNSNAIKSSKLKSPNNRGEETTRWKPKPKPTSNCNLGRGNDWGCCGNYKGCCHLWHETCWYHDVACIFCWPSLLCGPMCEPG